MTGVPFTDGRERLRTYPVLAGEMLSMVKGGVAVGLLIAMAGGSALAAMVTKQAAYVMPAVISTAAALAVALCLRALINAIKASTTFDDD